MCIERGSLLEEHLASFSKSSGARVCHWEEFLEKEFWVHLPMTTEMLLGPSRLIWLQNIPPEYHMKVRGAHFHWMNHLLKAEKPALVHRHTLAHCLPTFSGLTCQWRTFTLTITCLALVTSSWTHQR